MNKKQNENIIGIKMNKIGQLVQYFELNDIKPQEAAIIMLTLCCMSFDRERIDKSMLIEQLEIIWDSVNREWK